MEKDIFFGIDLAAQNVLETSISIYLLKKCQVITIKAWLEVPTEVGVRGSGKVLFRSSDMGAHPIRNHFAMYLSFVGFCLIYNSKGFFFFKPV